MKGTHKVLAGRYLMVLRAVAMLDGSTIEYWALNHATNTVNHAIPVHYGANSILGIVDGYCTDQGLPGSPRWLSTRRPARLTRQA